MISMMYPPKRLPNRLARCCAVPRFAAALTRSCTTASAVPSSSAPVEDEAPPPSLAARFKVTAEVCVSKIGPAGAGWWAANAFAADYLRYAPTDIGYFATTGLGDASAVFLGHSTYFLCKSMLVPSAKISMLAETQTATFLAGATFLSGFVWQPVCNIFESSPFAVAAAATGIGCGSAFFAGLRLGRTVLGSSGLFSYVEPPNLANLKDDAALSVAIAGATGTFVGVVVDFPDNPFIGTSIGILATASTASGCFSSSQATILGFGATQTAQNLLFPKGSNWIDGCLVDGTYKTPA